MIALIVLPALAILIYCLLQARNHARFKRWHNALRLQQHEETFTTLYQSVNGFALSRTMRQTQDAIEYVYGEIDFLSFIALLTLARPDDQTVFYDLGSGTGKAVIACAMVFEVKKSYGIEVFSALHQTALEQKARLNQNKRYQGIAKHIEFIHNDFLNTDFNDATLIFINASAFIGETWQALLQKLLKTHAGTTIILASKTLPPDEFQTLYSTHVQMSWGIVATHVYQRLKK